MRKLIEPCNEQESCNFGPHTIKRPRDNTSLKKSHCLCIKLSESLQYQKCREDIRRISYIRSPTPPHQNEGEYIEVSYKISQV